MKVGSTRATSVALMALAAMLGTAASIASAQARTGAPLPTVQRPPESQLAARYDADELDRVVSPVALYPDPLLAQLLTAATYSVDIPAAAAFSAEHRDLTGQSLTDAVAAEGVNWDPSVQAMLAFPTVLEMMAGDMPWTEELGDAFRSQPGDVMDAVQRMRARAHEYGYLQSNDQMHITRTGQTIEIQPTTVSYVVVPYYDPLVVFYPPRPRFVVGSAIYLGYGVRLGLWFEPWGWGPGGFNWASRRVIYGYPGWGRPWYGYGGSGRTVFYTRRRSSAVGPGRYASGWDWSRSRGVRAPSSVEVYRGRTGVADRGRGAAQGRGDRGDRGAPGRDGDWRRDDQGRDRDWDWSRGGAGGDNRGAPRGEDRGEANDRIQRATGATGGMSTRGIGVTRGSPDRGSPDRGSPDRGSPDRGSSTRGGWDRAPSDRGAADRGSSSGGSSSRGNSGPSVGILRGSTRGGASAGVRGGSSAGTTRGTTRGAVRGGGSGGSGGSGRSASGGSGARRGRP